MKISVAVALLLLIGLSFPVTADAQADSTNQKLVRTIGISGIPIVFYLPETRLGFGGAGIYTFQFSDQTPETRPSQVQLGLAYTLNDQVLLYLTHQFYLGKERWNIKGEWGYYRYFYDFFGVGNEVPEDFVENYGVTFPRIRYDFLYGINRNFYTGLRYWFDDYQLTDLDAEGLLIQGEIPGSESSVVSGLGWVTNLDTRDNIFYPSKGIYVETVAFFNRKALGSNFDFNRFTFDFTYYHALKTKHILATNFYLGWLNGTAPFNEMLLLGGRSRARGYYEGRYRDNRMLLLQSEYRFRFLPRFGITLFGSYGSVTSNWDALTLAHFRYNVGVGIRFQLLKESLINLRVDYGLGKNTSGLYFTIGEAF